MTEQEKLEEDRDKWISYLKKEQFIDPNTDYRHITPSFLLTNLGLESAYTEENPRQIFNKWCRMMFNPTYFILKFFDLLLQVLQIPFQIVKIVIFDETLDVFLRKGREKTPGTIFPYVKNLRIPFVKNLEKQREEELAKLDCIFDKEQRLQQKSFKCNQLIKVLEDLEKLKSNSKTDPHLQLLELIESQSKITEQENLENIKKELTDPNRDLLCPITQDLIKSPVKAADGFTYEEDSIKKWLKINPTSPMKGFGILKDLEIDEEYKKRLRYEYTKISKQKDLEGQKHLEGQKDLEGQKHLEGQKESQSRKPKRCKLD